MNKNKFSKEMLNYALRKISNWHDNRNYDTSIIYFEKVLDKALEMKIIDDNEHYSLMLRYQYNGGMSPKNRDKLLPAINSINNETNP